MTDKSPGRVSPLWVWFHAFAGLVCALTVCGFLGRFGWWLDLAAQFRFQYLIAACVAAAIAARGRRRTGAALYAVCALANLVVVAPLYWKNEPQPANGHATLRIMFLNVHARNPDPQRVIQAIRDSKADIVVLEEIDEDWQQPLAGVRSLYPHRFYVPRDQGFDIAILSARPIALAEMTYFGETEVRGIAAQFDVGNRRVLLITTRLVPALSPGRAAVRDRQLHGIVTYLKRHASLHAAVAVIGDLDLTPWSYCLKRFLGETTLKDSTQGFGCQPTWPAALLLLPLRIPADNCLISSDFVVTRRSTGWSVGSDHLPLLVDLALANH